MITYGQLYAFVRPFFLARGGDEFLGKEFVRNASNFAIQDIYNGDNATFTVMTERVQLTQQGDRLVGNTEFDIRHVIEAFANNGQAFQPELYVPKQEGLFKFAGNSIWIPTKITGEYSGYGSTMIDANQGITYLDISYNRDYKFVTESTEDSTIVPIPDRYVPALVKMVYDWASPISVLVGETDNPDFFAHAQTRLEQLKIDDGVSLSPTISKRGFNRNGI